MFGSEGKPRARIALLICNCILVTVGLACIAGGIVLMMGSQAYGDTLDWMQDLVVREAAKAGFSDLDASALDVKFVTRPLGTGFIVVGSIIIALGAFGIVASTGRYKILSWVYLVVMTLFLMTTAAMATGAYANSVTFEHSVKSVLKKSLVDYTGIAGNDSTTLGWNAIMMHFNCCGVDSYEDFSVSTNWVTEIGDIKLTTPVACCLERKANLRCTKRILFQERTYYDRGCSEHIYKYVASDTGVVLLTFYLMLLLEFLSLFLSIWINCVLFSKDPDEEDMMGSFY